MDINNYGTSSTNVTMNDVERNDVIQGPAINLKPRLDTYFLFIIYIILAPNSYIFVLSTVL